MEVPGSSKPMIATQEEMAEARVPIPYRDQCAHLLIPLNKCRHAEFFLPWKCENERHVYEKCEYELVMERMLQMQKILFWDLIGCEVVNVASAKLRFKHGLCSICRTRRGNLKGSQTLVHILIGWGTRIKMDRLVHTNNAIQPILSSNAQILKCRIDWEHFGSCNHEAFKLLRYGSFGVSGCCWREVILLGTVNLETNVKHSIIFEYFGFCKLVHGISSKLALIFYDFTSFTGFEFGKIEFYG
ncbi:hypothetical protein POTOM_037888 [Populus tomentosa]|uniref:NADH dehydrogenase [ubiquinone] 1 beta subcomplex subunit 7 n=1 Tax=Populus tomentosa TaxID=118781 RepID=A0A8X7YXM8_POPTO|nr:hypothetical protein POTOM_037888 [Populus tomentosa]